MELTMKDKRKLEILQMVMQRETTVLKAAQVIGPISSSGQIPRYQ